MVMRILTVCMLLMVACGKDKSTAVVIEEEVEELRIFLYDGWDEIVELENAPLNVRVLDYLTNRADEYDARDIYSITSSGNGRIFLDLDYLDDYPVPLYVWVTDTDGGLYIISHFSIGQENVPIDTIYYGNRNLIFGVGVEDAYRSIPPADPEFDFTFNLIVKIP